MPVPFGLVRFGVAPDHPEVKSVSNDFNSVLSDPRVRFIGNIEVGRDIKLTELISYYDATVLSYGSQSERSLAIPNRNLKNIFPARSFVNWYNSHPDHQNDKFELNLGETAIIIGQGNVAIDCARMLLAPNELLSVTDISPLALDSLTKSSIKNVHLIGRRGPAQSAFTTAEFREITGIPGIDTVIDMAAVKEAETGISAMEVENNRPKKRKLALIKEIAMKPQSNTNNNENTKKKIYFDFFLSPVEFIENPTKPGYVEGIKFEKMKLKQIPNSLETESIGTKEYIIINGSLILESIGYRSQSIDSLLPFNSKSHVIQSKNGRVENLSRVYVSGWLKRGPTGIIGSNISDARETVAAIVEDLNKENREKINSDEDFIEILTSRGLRIVDNEGWKKIDQYEINTGKNENKNRYKLSNIEEMLKIAKV